MNDLLFKRIVREVAPFDALDLLTDLAALQLTPVNISRTVRLEVLAHAVAHHLVDGSRLKASLEDLRHLCNDEPVSSFELVRSEDPPEWHFVEPLVWRKTSFLVFPGIVDDSAFSFRHLASAFEPPFEALSDSSLVSESSRLIEAVLRLSTEVARRSGLGRWTNPQLTSNDTVIPSAGEFEKLRHAAVFQKSELDELLADQGGASALQRITTVFGVGPSTYDRHNGALLATPVVQHGSTYVVAIPGLLLDAVRHQLISAAMAAGVVGEVGHRFATAIWSGVAGSLGKLGMTRVSPVTPFAEIPNAQGAVYQFDADKYAHVILIPDPFHDYRPDTIFGSWSLQPFQEAIEARARRIVTAAEQNRDTVMTLVVVQGAGSEHHFNLSALPADTLAMRASELETISYAEGGRPLALWNFVQARERLRRDVHIQAASLLDEFEMYRPRHSFYFSDDPLPNVISIEVGTGFSTRKYVADRYDPHAEKTETGGETSLVVKIIDATVPVYADIGRAERRVAFFVDGLPIPTWVLGPENIESNGATSRTLNFDLVQGLAYWLWQFTPGLTRHLRPHAGQERLTICLDLPGAILDRDLNTGDPTSPHI